jgi:hypothetical protein
MIPRGRCWRGQSGDQLYLLSLRWASDLNSVIDDVLHFSRSFYPGRHSAALQHCADGSGA